MLVKSNQVQIQILKRNVWVGVHNSDPSPFYYLNLLRKLKDANPGSKVRVVDSNGRLLDIIL